MSKSTITLTIAILAVVLGGWALVGGNSQPEQRRAGGSSDSGFNATGSGDFQVDGTTVIDTNGNIDAAITSSSGTFSGSLGVASTSVDSAVDFAVGTKDATSTTMYGTFCAYAEDTAGRSIWITLSTSSNTVFSTSTSPCNTGS